MANVEINDIAAQTTPADTDELEVQLTGGGASKKMTRANFLKVGSELQAYDADTAKTDVAETVSAEWTLNPLGTGGLTDIDVSIGDTDGSPTYGMIQIGNATFGRTSFNAANLDLDGSLILWNNGAPAASNIEFAFAESSNSIRFAIPKSGAGNATYNPRSMLIAGPAPADDTMVTVGYWRTNNSIFHNIDCDTGTNGADLGVQNDLEVEGDIFTDSIKESTSAAGVTIDGLLIKDGDTKVTESMVIACSDESTALTTGTAKVTFRMPYAFTLTAVRASATTAPTGATLTVDINEAGTTILSTKITIDATEKTSTTAATAAVISDSALADDAEMTIDIDQIGSTIAGAGLKVYLIGHRT